MYKKGDVLGMFDGKVKLIVEDSLIDENGDYPCGDGKRKCYFSEHKDLCCPDCCGNDFCYFDGKSKHVVFYEIKE